MQQLEIHSKAQLDQVEGLDIFAPDLIRLTEGAGSHPDDIAGENRRGIDLGNDTRHCMIHDLHSVGWWWSVKGGTLYDAIIKDIGWKSNDPDDTRNQDNTAHGHGLYLQNSADSPEKLIDSCVIVGAFGMAGKILSTGTNTMHHFRVRNTIFTGKQFLVGGPVFGASDITFQSCSFLDCPLALGYIGQNEDAVVEDCLFAAPDGTALSIGSQDQYPRTSPSWKQLRFVGNTFVGHSDRVVLLPAGFDPAWTWDNNTYYSTHSKPFRVWTYQRNPDGTPKRDSQGRPVGGYSSYSFDEWKRLTGFDAHSTFINGTPPTIMRLYPVPERHAVNAAVVNLQEAKTVAIPEAITSSGQVSVRYIRNYEMVYDGDEFIMSGEVAKPRNWNSNPTEMPLARAGFPKYGIFRLEVTPTETGDTPSEPEGREITAELAAALTALAAKDARIEELSKQIESKDTDSAALRRALKDVQATSADLREIVARGYSLSTAVSAALRDYERTQDTDQLAAALRAALKAFER